MWGFLQGTPVQQDTPTEPRSRSERNVAVLGSKEPRQVLTFLNGLRGSILLYELLPAESARGVVNSPRGDVEENSNGKYMDELRAIWRGVLPHSAGSGAVCLFRPFKNVSTWRGPFEPSTATFLSERERV